MQNFCSFYQSAFLKAGATTYVLSLLSIQHLALWLLAWSRSSLSLLSYLVSLEEGTRELGQDDTGKAPGQMEVCENMPSVLIAGLKGKAEQSTVLISFSYLP